MLVSEFIGFRSKRSNLIFSIDLISRLNMFLSHGMIFIIAAAIIIVIGLEFLFHEPVQNMDYSEHPTEKTHGRFVGASVNRGSIRDCGHRNDGSFDVGFGITKIKFQ